MAEYIKCSKIISLIKTLVFLLPVLMALITASCASSAKTGDLPNWIKNQPPGINFTGLAPSPDGKVIVFEYIDRSLGRNYLGLGMLNWQTGELKRIPNPPEQQLSEPSFSEDGKKLVVTSGHANGLRPHHLSIVDLTTMKITLLPVESHGLSYPVFQPGTGNILYGKTTKSFHYGLFLLDPATKNEQVVIDEDNGFYDLRHPSFVSQDKILFQAGGANEPELRKRTIDFPSVLLAYYFKFGQKPEFLSLEDEWQAKKLVGGISGAFWRLSASQDGDFISYVKETLEKGKVTSELFQYKNGQAIQLTNNRRNITLARGSTDGSAIAFAADITERGKYDLFIYNTKTRETIATSLLDRIRNNPEFALK